MTDERFHTVRGVVFDMDGTLTESELDFKRIRSECGIPLGQPILEYLDESPEPARSRARRVLHRHERRAARRCTLRDGVPGLLRELRRRGLRLALLTRNSADSMRTVLRRFDLCFDASISRDDAPPKPSAEPVLRIGRRLGLEPEQLLVVGDYVFDVQAGRAAGALTAFVQVRSDLDPPPEADVVVEELSELLHLLPDRVKTGGTP